MEIKNEYDEKKIEEELFRAINDNEFILHYQPVINLVNNCIMGFEALARWNHPERGLVMPDDFIPIAEKTSLIIPLGFKVIEEAAGQLKKWQNTYEFDKSLKMSVNLSAKQFLSHELCDTIFGIVERKNINPEDFIFEITESTLMDDVDSANMMLLKLKARNFRIYMDDFGTGYSSLTYLRHFPVDTLKIDRSFVQWMHIDDQSEVIVRAVIGLAHNLKMKVVAEGVDQEVHISMLKDYGCDYCQGYFISKPMDIIAAGEFIKGHRNGPCAD
ncbi:MAG: EAL domain-containing protein [Spirochaetes bacterium]|nr:EAL domain-containing protein [Spirochaetota bacterium]